MYEDRIIEEIIKSKINNPSTYEFVEDEGYVNIETDVEKPAVVYNTPFSKLKKMLTFELEGYQNIQSEIRVFIDKNKNKKFNIYVIYFNPHQLAWEYVYKIKPIIQFIIVRNRHPAVTDRFVKILDHMDNLGIDKYIREVANGGNYTKSIHKYKLEHLLSKHEADLRDLVLFMFNAQPIKQRMVSQQVVGMGQNEFDDMTSDEEE